MLQTGAIIDGRYVIRGVIGRGGTSCVYLAENTRIKKNCAVKEVYKNGSGTTASGGIQNGLIAESAMLTKLHHPSLPDIIDVFESPHAFYVVMEYIEGKPLNKKLQQGGAQPEEQVVRWAKQLCDVLQYLHSQQPAIIYRDMKPANIMLKPDGNVSLIDFGTAREYKAARNSDTIQLGTHGYAAPEQYSSTGQSDARTDIYCLGVTLYHLISGCDPCQPPYGLRPIRAINPLLSAKMEYIIQKCTQLNPNDRYQSAAELMQDLNSTRSFYEYLPESDGQNPKNSKTLILLATIIPAVIVIIGVTLALTLSNNSEPIIDTEIDNSGGYSGEYYFTPEPIETMEPVTSEGYYEGVSLPLQPVNDVVISEEGEHAIYHFVPTQSGMYNFYSVSGDEVPIAWLSDASNVTLSDANTYGIYEDFDFSSRLEANQLYYLEVALSSIYDGDPETGYVQVYVEFSSE